MARVQNVFKSGKHVTAPSGGARKGIAMTSEHKHEWEYLANEPRCTICEHPLGQHCRKQNSSWPRRERSWTIATPNMEKHEPEHYSQPHPRRTKAEGGERRGARAAGRDD